MERPVENGSDADPILEKSQLEGLLDAAGADGVQEILDAFWRSTSDLIGNLSQCLKVSNWGDAARAAHALKGSAANVGAVLLASTARDIENSCKSTDADAAKAALDQTSTAFEKTKHAFKAHLDDYRRSA